MQRFFHLFQSRKQASLRNIWNRYCMWFVLLLLNFCQCNVFLLCCIVAARAQPKTSGTTGSKEHFTEKFLEPRYRSGADLWCLFQWRLVKRTLTWMWNFSFSSVKSRGFPLQHSCMYCRWVWEHLKWICSALTWTNVFLCFPVFCACSSSWR